MATIVALLATITTLLCAALLLRRYAVVKLRLLLWSGLCFSGLALANGLLVADLAGEHAGTYTLRLAITAGALMLLVFGLIWESD